MPIVNRPTNNRLLPTNTRAVDVARQSIDRILGHQARRYDNAFQVQGFQAVLYSKLKCGTKCMCQTKASKVPKSLLDEEGNARPGVINGLLTGQKFGSLPYGAVPTTFKNIFEPIVSEGYTTGIGGLYEEDEPQITKPIHGAPGTGFIEEDDFELSNSSVIISDGFSDAGPVSGTDTIAKELFDNMDASGFESGFDTSTDVACPICFGTGFVGGFSVYNGNRVVLDSQLLDAEVRNNAQLDIEPFVPLMTGQNVTFQAVLLTKGAVSVDSLRVYNGIKVVPAKVFIDGLMLASENKLMDFCNGKPHVFSFDLLAENAIMTHVEIQYNQSVNKTLFEFPKLSQGSIENLLERTEAFQITMSPVIPNITGGDVITDSTYGKVLQITTSNWWNDKRRAVLGWDCGVRPCQPQELYTLLPKRKVMESQHTVNMPKANTDKRF